VSLTRLKTSGNLSAQEQTGTAVTVVETNYRNEYPDMNLWGDVPIAEVSEQSALHAAHLRNEKAKQQQRYFWPAA